MTNTLDQMLRPSNSNRKRELHSSQNAILLLGGGALFFSLVSIFGPTRHVVEHHHSVSMSHIPHTKKTAPPPPRKIIRVEELAHEDMWKSTIRSCLPKEKKICKEYVIPDSDPRVQRVALLSPPGVISSTLMNQIQLVAHKHNNRDSKVEPDIDVFETTHVPPYGYGKTHGLTKIIRVVPQPLVLEVTDALQALLQTNEDASDITLEDLKSTLRQVLRFHCRLSHVAAHTALLSIPFLDMVSEPESVTEIIDIFLTPKDSPEPEKESDENAADDDSMSLFDSEEAYGARMLSYVQEKSSVDVLHVLDEVLLEEMELTKNMTAWPCPGFWNSGDPKSPTVLSNITQRLAKKLAPDCSDPLVSCFVARDKCEAVSDGVCKDHK